MNPIQNAEKPGQQLLPRFSIGKTPLLQLFSQLNGRNDRTLDFIPFLITVQGSEGIYEHGSIGNGNNHHVDSLLFLLETDRVDAVGGELLRIFFGDALSGNIRLPAISDRQTIHGNGVFTVSCSESSQRSGVGERSGKQHVRGKQ